MNNPKIPARLPALLLAVLLLAGCATAPAAPGVSPMSAC